MIKVGIIGATGYAGGELVRILMGHKDAEIKWYGSRSYVDQKYADVYRNMFQIVDAKCMDDNMEELADEGPCVMVGRCADYALADWKDCFSVFVHADIDCRISRIAAKHNKSPKEARDMINKTDKSRASYYNYYTNKKWGAAKSYDLCIDSGKLGIENSVKTIIEAIKIFDESKNK